jgi:FAD/FMN-containing dehydrogenase
MQQSLEALAGVVGAAHVLTGSDTARYVVDERGLFHGRALAVIRPADAREVAEVVRVCVARGVGMVPQGGNTGYCGGATPDPSGTQVVVSLERLNAVLAVDANAYTMTVQAGVVLAQAQAAAAQHARLLPLSMGSQESCQIGGNLSTNAGGLAVLKYGTARELVLGLEVVLPDGRILDRLTTLRKDNTGYDLKQLFVGAEGTLGIITAATLKLHPAVGRHTAWASVRDVAAACALLADLRALSADAVTSFEYISAHSLGHVRRALPALTPPLAAGEHHVLIECLDPEAEPREESAVTRALAQALDTAGVEDAVLAQNETQRRALWRIREGIPAAEKALGGSIKHDVSVALGDVPAYVERASAVVRARWPEARLSIYGHIGDGNVHFNVLAPEAADADAFRRGEGAGISTALHDLAHAMRGSFSAEHGIGVLKRDTLGHYGDPVALDVMRALKERLDPRGLMNPGKLVPVAAAV